MPDAHPEDFYMKDQFGRIIDYSEEALEADPKRKHMIINSVKEDFINHDLRATTHNVGRLPTKIAVKYNLPLPIAEQVTGSIISDPRSAVDSESIVDTVFVYRNKEE
jgi:hypothetical protein